MSQRTKRDLVIAVGLGALIELSLLFINNAAFGDIFTPERYTPIKRALMFIFGSGSLSPERYLWASSLQRPGEIAALFVARTFHTVKYPRILYIAVSSFYLTMIAMWSTIAFALVRLRRLLSSH
jgi:hypothetical protein